MPPTAVPFACPSPKHISAGRGAPNLDALVVSSPVCSSLLPTENLTGKSSGQIFPASGPPFGVCMLLPWVLRCLLSALLWSLPLIAPTRYHRPITSTRVRTAIWCQRSSSTGAALSATCALLVFSPACSAHLTPDNPRSLITSSRHPDRHMVSACFFPGCCIACWLGSSGELSIGAGSYPLLEISLSPEMSTAGSAAP